MLSEDVKDVKESDVKESLAFMIWTEITTQVENKEESSLFCKTLRPIDVFEINTPKHC